MKLERLISIIYKLLNHVVLLAAMLAEEFKVSQRTIYRDNDVICAAGFLVVPYQGTKGGYGMMDGYKMDKILLGTYDVNALITVLRSLSTVFEDERAQGTIERLQTIGPEHLTQSLSVDLDTLRTEPDAPRHIRTPAGVLSPAALTEFRHVGRRVMWCGTDRRRIISLRLGGNLRGLGWLGLGGDLRGPGGDLAGTWRGLGGGQTASRPHPPVIRTENPLFEQNRRFCGSNGLRIAYMAIHASLRARMNKITDSQSDWAQKAVF